MSWDAAIDDALRGRRVFLTGHTGFKGSWLTAWLHRYQCQITGYALPPNTTPSHFEIAGLAARLVANHAGDIRDSTQLTEAMTAFQPDVVIHMAAQPLVRQSYAEPLETWSTNALGTANVLEAVRHCPSIKAVLVITTDKCYENREWPWGYRENDMLGGYDPYSASKAAAELVVQSYRKSFFNAAGPLLASARAGNVIGGGDWGQDRLIPDAVRALQGGRPLAVRNPHATRPWQHVLACLHGYLLLVARLLEGDATCATAFNFGPSIQDNRTVDMLLEGMNQHWPELAWQCDQPDANTPMHEANYLYLDSSLARQKLGWLPRWGLDTALRETATWYRAVWEEPGMAAAVTDQQIQDYLAS